MQVRSTASLEADAGPSGRSPGRVSARGSWLGSHREALRALLGYLAVFTLLSPRWIRTMAIAIPAARDIPFTYGDDARLHIWILAWVAHAIATAPARLLDANINYPAPRQLTGSEHFATSQLVFGPVYALTGNPVLAANVLV